jgi:hypothetical protein
MRYLLGLLLLSLTSCSHASLPTRLKIDGFEWKIEYVHDIPLLASDPKHHPIYIGNTICIRNLLQVLDKENETDVYGILVHEVQHAFTCDKGFVHNEDYNNLVNKDQKDEDYHSGIYWATPHWVRFIQDNPEFILRLEELKPPLVPDDPPPYY